MNIESQRPKFKFYLYCLDQILELPCTCLFMSEVGLHSALWPQEVVIGII